MPAGQPKKSQGERGMDHEHWIENPAAGIAQSLAAPIVGLTLCGNDLHIRVQLHFKAATGRPDTPSGASLAEALSTPQQGATTTSRHKHLATAVLSNVMRFESLRHGYGLRVAVGLRGPR